MIIWRWLKWAIIITVLLLALLLIWLLTTSAGLRTVLNEAAPYIPGTLTVERVEGRLLGPLKLHGVRYQHDALKAEVGSLTLGWRPSALFRERAHITQLTLNQSTITLAPPQPTASADPVTLPDIKLPIAVRLDDVRVNQLRIQQSQKPLAEINALQFSAHSAGDVLHLPALSLRLPNAVVGASGQLTPQQHYSLQFAAHWQFSPPNAAVIQGQSQLSGNLSGDAPTLTIHSRSRKPYRSQLTAEITDLLNTLRFNVRLNTPGITLNAIQPNQPPLQIRGKVQLTGKLDNYQIRTNLTSKLPEQPALKIRAQAHGNLAELTLDKLHGESDAGHFQASGRLQWQKTLRWAFKAKARNLNPGVVVPDWPGKLNFALNSQGKYAKNHLSGELHLPELYGQLRDEALSGHADIQLNPTGHTAAALTIDLGDKHLTANVTGTAEQHSATLQARTPQIVADLELSGQFAAQPVAGAFQLNRADVTPTSRDRWQLAQPLHGEISQAGLDLARGCWGSGPATICGQANADSGGWKTKGELTDFPLHWLTAAQPELNITGNLNGSFSAQGQPPTAQAQLRLSAGEVRHQQFANTAQEWLPLLTFNGGTLNVNWLQPSATITLAVDLASGGNLAADINVQPDNDIGRSLLSGSINARLNDLRLAPVLLPEIAAVDGHIAVALTLGGQLNAPQINGELALDANNANIPALGINVSELNARLRPDGQKFTFTLQATSGGTLTIDGNGELRKGQPMLSASIRGDKFLAVDLPAATATISPDIAITLQQSQLAFSGTLRVPSATLHPEAAQTGAITVSEDQIIVDAPEAAQTGLQIAGTLKLVLGDAVHLEGFGLKTRLAGQLTVIEQHGKLARGHGEIRMEDGSYAAFGQELTIEYGRLLFAGGPITRPLLDLRALRKLPDPPLKIGANLRGTPDAPKVTLFSEPALSQTDTLAYLVAGRPLRQTDAAQTDLLAKAALALRLRSARFITEQISSRLGLEDLSLQADSQTDQAQLVLGKYLSPRLYVSYGLGVFDTSHTLLARYILSPRWYLEARSDGSVSSGDIFFNLESGD